VRTRVEWTYEDTLDLSTPKDRDQLSLLKSLTNGTGSDQVNRMWHDRRRLSQSSGTDSLDLAGGLTDVFGNVLTFTKIKVLFVFNKGVRSGSTWVQTAGQDILVGGAASNAWAAWLNDNQAAEARVRSGGVLLMTCPEEGWRVSPGASDILQVTWDGSAASGDDIDYDIILMGVA
jgi:hypothetical protein